MSILRPAALLLILASAALVACRPTLQVRVETRVFHDGSIERTLFVVGRTAEAEQPEETGWLAEAAGVQLAEPEAWGRVERSAGRVYAEGFFRRAGDLPPLLALGNAHKARPTQGSTSLEIEDGVLMRRWSYHERVGDPFTALDRAQALRKLVAVAADLVADECRAQFGENGDIEPVRNFVNDEVLTLTSRLLSVNRNHPGKGRLDLRLDEWRSILRGRGIPVTDSEGEFWESQFPLLFDWARGEIAERLAESGVTGGVERPDFLPGGSGWEDRAGELVERHLGETDEIVERYGDQFRAISGFFGDGGAPHFRFESAVTLPGTILNSNSRCVEATCRWLFRGEDLRSRGAALAARSVEPIDEALVELGARRTFDEFELLQLADMLWKRDPQNHLKSALAEAVRRKNLDWILEEDVVPDELDYVVAELYELLVP